MAPGKAAAATTVNVAPIADCYVTESVTQNQCSLAELRVGQVQVKRWVCSDACGWVTTWHRAHTLLHFDVNSAVPAGAEIVSAQLSLRLESGGINGLVDVAPVLPPWTSAATWTERDAGRGCRRRAQLGDASHARHPLRLGRHQHRAPLA
jgi:hypothetical protein